MSLDAVDNIHADLARESKARTLRGWLLLAIWGAMAAGLTVALGLRPDLQPGDALAQSIAGAFVLLGAVLSMSPSLRFGGMAARAIGVVAVLSPLLAARAIGTSDGILGGTFACMGVISGVGLVTLVLARIVLGATRRRFGGAPVIQGVAAAMVGSLAVGLHCPMSDAAHLVTHALGVLIVASLLRRLIFAES